jgi:hypothetical protein
LLVLTTDAKGIVMRHEDLREATQKAAQRTKSVQGACRHLVKDRMDLTGARWRLQSAEAVLKLRSLRSSGDFEAYWRFHKQQELERHHLSRYAECLFLEDFRVED